MPETWSYSSLESIPMAHFEAKSHVIIIEGLCIEVDNIKRLLMSQKVRCWRKMASKIEEKQAFLCILLSFSY